MLTVYNNRPYLPYARFIADNSDGSGMDDILFESYGSIPGRPPRSTIYFQTAGGSMDAPTSVVTNSFIMWFASKYRIGNYYASGPAFGSAYRGNGSNASHDFSIDNMSVAAIYISPTDNVGLGLGATVEGIPNLPDEKLHVGGRVKAIAYDSGSDRRYKQDITPLTSGLLTVSKLNPVHYYWNAEGKKTGGDDKLHYGFIAQEMETVMPTLVSSNSNGYKSISYIEIIPVLTKAIQEQQTQIETLQQEMNELKALVKQLLEKQ